MKSKFIPILCLCAAGLIAGCEAYERTNPLDPSYPLVMTIIGPDTIRSVNDTIVFQLTTEPAHSGLPVVWTTSAINRLAMAGDQPGTFASVANGTALIRVQVGPHSTEKEIVIEQRAVGLSIFPEGPVQLVSLGEFLNLTASTVDAKNTPVAGAATDLVWLSSNVEVADIVGGRVTARANGQTWVHATSLGQTDSVRVVVQQLPATMQFGNAAYTIGFPGGTVQTALTIRDARNNLIASPAGLSVTSSRSTFQVTPGGLVLSSGYGSTVITARIGELTASTSVRVTGGTAPVVTSLTAGLTGFPGQGRNFLLVEMETRDAELDMEVAMLEVYTASGTFMVPRTVDLVQGQATLSTSLGIPGTAGAGEVRVRVRDAAPNTSPQTIWNVTPQPHATAPDVNVVGTSTNAQGTFIVSVQPIGGTAALRALHLFGFDASGEVVLSSRLSQPSAAGAVISLPNPASIPIAFLGVVVSDINGGVSLVKRIDLSAGSARIVTDPRLEMDTTHPLVRGAP